MRVVSCNYDWKDSVNKPTIVFAMLEFCTFGPFALVDYEIDYQDPSYYGFTALMYACYYRNYPSVVTLISKGANIEIAA